MDGIDVGLFSFRPPFLLRLRSAGLGTYNSFFVFRFLMNLNYGDYSCSSGPAPAQALMETNHVCDLCLFGIISVDNQKQRYFSSFFISFHFVCNECGRALTSPAHIHARPAPALYNFIALQNPFDFHLLRWCYFHVK